MVKLTEVNAANAALKSALPSPTAVVVGGTNGIGRSFLAHLTKYTTSPKIYVVGRTQEQLTAIVTELSTLNPSGTYIPVEAPDLTLVADAHAAATQIAARESESDNGRIDILYLSPGYLTFSGRDESPEGLDRATAIRYYSRLRFVADLLPLLERAPGGGRVVDVLSGGQEGPLFPDDLAMTQPAHSGAMATVQAAAAYTTLAFEHLAAAHPAVAFVHTFPGIVRTKAYARPAHLGAVARFLFSWVFFPVFGWLIETSADEAGARTLYAATSPEFASVRDRVEGTVKAGSDGQKGSGAYTLNDKSEAVQNKKVLGPFREQGMGEKVWQFTLAEFDRILGTRA
jgi:NAD(P)-dependent dehydrogenase (short-subunit alcohol dehydrogenase family)